MDKKELVKQIRVLLNSEGLENPINTDRFATNKQDNTKLVSLFSEFLLQLGFDLDSKDLKDTPRRVVEYFTQDQFYGLNYANFPDISVTQNQYQYSSPIIAKGITVNSVCEHHLTSITGTATVLYCVKENVIGLSCINKIVDFFSHRPQVQERLSRQIIEVLKLILNTEDVAVIIKAHHDCIIKRSIKEQNSEITTIEVSGEFQFGGKYHSLIC